MATVLIVEDEAPLREALAAYLTRAGLTVLEADRGDEGWRLFRAQAPDLVVLDRLLPGLSGEELCRRIKALGPTPVILATSLIQEDAALEGFALGADDYVRKPYSPKEMTARILARLRAAPVRTLVREVPSLGLRIDAARGLVTAGPQSLALTPHELGLLIAFVDRPDRVVSRAELLAWVWPDDDSVTDRAVDSHIKNLRAKLTAALGAEPPLQTVYGRGYRWSP